MKVSHTLKSRLQSDLQNQFLKPGERLVRVLPHPTRGHELQQKNFPGRKQA
jgi:hypothetical protein